MHRATAGSDRGIVALWDADSAPTHLRDAEDREMLAALETAGLEGDVFWVDDEEPASVSTHFHLFVEEEPPPLEYKMHRPIGGTFLLRVPSGRLVVGGVEHWCSKEEGTHALQDELAIPPGNYAVTVRHQQYDNEIIRREMQDIVGLADWRFKTRIEWAGSIGCLPILVCIVLTLLSSWSLLLKVALPVTLVYWLFAAGVRQLPRYRRVTLEEKRFFERQHVSGESAANLVLVLKQVHDTTHLSGGCLDISS